ncbi:DUF6053 domain-containing protein [Lysobacter enzymogenes]|uniref:DUF6053 domain-containing protein n=1 Tax=Lysobacter enzymogenes TaxID=69 RepID=UPI003D18AEF6
MGGPSGPMLRSQIGAIRPESIGPEGPPTKAARAAPGRDRPTRADQSRQISAYPR